MVFMNKKGRRARLGLAAIAAAGLLLTACSSGSNASQSHSPGQPLNVVAAFYPLQYAAEQVGGNNVKVTSLTPPGVEPHDLELTPAQVAEIRNADAVLYIPGFQPAVDAAIEQQAPDKAIDVTKGTTLLAGAPESGGANGAQADATDPHIWLNPANMTTIGKNIETALANQDPSAAPALATGEQSLTSKMSALSDEFATGLKSCRTKDLVVSHEAFAYLAGAYGFTQVGISGLSPDAEPSPARVKEVSDIVKAKGVTTVYYETLVDPKVAETIARETGATAAVLDPLEGLAPGSSGDYESVMRTNLATLKQGQKC